MKVRSVLIALFGLWLMAAPWYFGYTQETTAMWASILVGLIQIMAALWSMFRPVGDSLPNLITLITGLFMAITPFIQPINDHKQLWIGAALGVLTILLSFTNLGTRRKG
ncbi:SPW repeat protein [Paenibacillus sp. UNC451MF]|uniref:SPW repeat protein n=1 Tax=Paenibacillus sp. UNC451MF TaxID=1449063 RepID=UPI00048F3E51|nr:SPW repeat protein [Paenibacillus sp. UNC451MF]